MTTVEGEPEAVPVSEKAKVKGVFHPPPFLACNPDQPLEMGADLTWGITMTFLLCTKADISTWPPQRL